MVRLIFASVILAILFSINVKGQSIDNLIAEIDVLKKTGEADSLIGKKLNRLGVVYYEEKLYEKALIPYQESRAILKSSLGDKHPYYMQVLQNRTLLFTAMNKQDSLISNQEEILAIELKTLGSTSRDYGYSLNDLGILYENNGMFEKAKSCYQKCLLVFKNLEPRADYYAALKNLAKLYVALKEFPSAISAYLEIASYKREDLPTTSFAYGNALNEIGESWVSLKNSNKAIPYFEEAVAVWDSDTSIVSYKLMALRSLYDIYSDREQYVKLIDIDLKRLKYLANSKRLQNLVSVNYLLGQNYGEIYKRDSSILYYEVAKNLIESNPALKFEETESLYNRLGAMYSKSGDKKNAAANYLTYLKILASANKQNTEEYAYQLNIIGVAYSAANQSKEAMLYYDLANKLYFNLSGELNNGYIQSLSNIAVLHNEAQNFEESQKLLTKASFLSEKAFGDTSAFHIEILNSLADVSYNQKRFEQALISYQKAQSLAILTINNNLQLACLINVAKTNASLNNFDLAIAQYKKVIELKKFNNDTSATAIVPSLNSLGNLYLSKSNFKEAEKYFMQSLAAINTNKNLNTEVLSALNGLGNLNRKLGSYKESENYFLKALKVASHIFGDPSKELANYQNNISLVYGDMGDYKKAFYFAEKSFAMDSLSGELSIDYATGLTNLAFLYNQTGDYKKAEGYLIKALEIYKLNGEKAKNYATALGNLGVFYKNYGSYDKAEVLMKQSLALLENLAGKKSEDYRFALTNLANFHNTNGNYLKGLSEINEALTIAELLFGDNSLIFASTLEQKASLLASLSKLKEAKEGYFKALEIRKKILGVNHNLYANLVATIGRFYLNTDQYDLARPLFDDALIIFKNTFGTNSVNYAIVITNLGDLETALGNYEKAEEFYMQAKEIYRISKGEKSLDFASILNNIASFYGELGQYEKQVSLYEQSASIKKELLGENHVEYGKALNNLAVANQLIDNPDKAELLQIKAIEIEKNANGIISIEYATRISNLASIYADQKKNLKAEEYYKKALALFSTLTGDSSIAYTTTLGNSGSLYESSGRYKEALEIFLKVKDVRAKVFGLKHPSYARILQGLYLLSLKTDDYVAAESYINTIVDININYLSESFVVLSEQEKGVFLANNISLLEDLNSFIYKYPKASSATRRLSFDLLLKLKSLTLNETKNVFNRVKISTDTTVVKLYKSWLADKTYLSYQYNLNKTQQDSNLRVVENRTEDLEKQLAKKSSTFKDSKSSLVISYQDVQKKLAKDEVAIEFVRFNYYDKKWTDSFIYAAYLLRATDTVPQFIPLCEAKKLNKLFEVAGKNSTAMVNSFYRGTKVTNINKDVLSDSLYNLVWKPLEPYLTGVSKINYSPAGKLYSIAFNALKDSEGKLLIDKFKFQQYTSTREIALKDDEITSSTPKTIALFGDATFSLDSAKLVSDTTAKNTSVSFNLPTNRGGSKNAWLALPGTLNEVNSINKLFGDAGLKSSTFVQRNASEQNFKLLSNHSPQILHVATHGFFLPDPVKNPSDVGKSTYELAKDPMLRSGLILAGGNYAWAGGKQLANSEDGILTAYEISQLDLGQTDLVVLSACETALGDVKGSEGVFGLQRSFKLAGAKNMILSLWQVPDKETAELMTIFYSNLLAGKAMDESFAIAQTSMRKKYDPFYWAAFVLIK